MNEQKLIKKELFKNMAYTFIVITVLFLILDLIVFNQVKGMLFETIDEELKSSIKTYSQDSQFGQLFKLSPRVIYIVRDAKGNVTNQNSIGRLYEEYLLSVNFDKNTVGKIYTLNVKNQYMYRGITVKIVNQYGGTEGYIQLLANIDGEMQTLKNVSNMLFFGTAITILVSVLASFILSRGTLRPIITAWKRQTEFVQNASHELRTPLAIIQAKQQLLLKEPESRIIDKSEDINLIIKESRRLSKLVKELMVLATADSNDLVLKKEKVNIDSLIKEITAPYIDYAELEEKKVTLDLNCEKELNIDKDRISQVIIILLDNAIKYTGKNETIEILTHSKDDKCIIEVKDTGIGISKEGQKHIFERFYREDKARSRESGGTGLGLSIAYILIKLHGGSIKVSNNEPKGTKFVIKI